jgi:hypothetical protein
VKEPTLIAPPPDPKKTLIAPKRDPREVWHTATAGELFKALIPGWKAAEK